MGILDSAIITKVQNPKVVHFKKGHTRQMKDRKLYGLSFCLSGQISYTIQGKKYISNPRNAVLLPKGGAYSICGDTEGLFPVIDFDCDNFECNDIIILSPDNLQSCIRDFETIRDLFLYNKSRLKIYSTFYELLSKVTSENLPADNPLSAVIEYIEDNISDARLSNTELARHIGISEVYLRKLFSAHYKTGPKQYITDIRIRKAKQMLVSTPFTITAIAAECGFSSLYHFCRAFKDKTGMTPTEYARINKAYQI